MATRNPRQISTVHLDFGDRYDGAQMRQLMEHVSRMTSEMQRIMGALSGGVGGQLFGKASGADYDAGWVSVGEDGATIQIGWDAITDKPGTFPPDVHTHEWEAISNTPPQRILQSTQEVYYEADDFLKGLNIIAVRYAGPAFVYLPHDLPSARVIAVKDELGSGDVTVRIY